MSDQPYLIEHCGSYTLPSSGWTLQGYSIAGVRTGFRIKEKKILLDAGVACDVRSTHIFITHAHSDHTLNLPVCCTPWRPATVICNPATYSAVFPFMESTKLLADGEGESVSSYVQVSAGEDFTLPDLKGLNIQTFPCYHTVECTAYGFREIRKKLKPEYANMDRKELGKLRQEGIELTHEVYVPQLLFCGDTSVEFFERASPEVFTYPVIMIECTSIDENEAEVSRSRGHMNFHALRPWIQQHPEIQFILFHHSQKTKAHEVPRESNVMLWMGPTPYSSHGLG